VLGAARIVIAAHGEEPDPSFLETLHLALERQLRLDRQQRIVVEVSSRQHRVELALDREVDRSLEGFEGSPPQSLAGCRATAEARLEVEVGEV
jgi:hypothetical protein